MYRIDTCIHEVVMHKQCPYMFTPQWGVTVHVHPLHGSECLCMEASACVLASIPYTNQWVPVLPLLHGGD